MKTMTLRYEILAALTNHDAPETADAIAKQICRSGVRLVERACEALVEQGQLTATGTQTRRVYGVVR